MAVITITQRNGSKGKQTVFGDEFKAQGKKKRPAINQITHVLFTLRGISNTTRQLYKKARIKIKHATLSQGTKKEEKRIHSLLSNS